MSKKKVADKVFVALPIYSWVFPEFFFSVMRLIQASPIKCEFFPLVGDSLVSRARNNLVYEFLKTDCTHLLFLDCDLQFNPWQIKRLMDHNAPIVGGMYPKKQNELAWVTNCFDKVTEPDANGLLPVKCIGTGAMMIRRDVIQTMQDAYPMLRYDADSGDKSASRWDLFKVGVWPCLEIPRQSFPQRPIGKEYELPEAIESQLVRMRDESRHLSEDWFFCYLAWNLGIPTFADLRNVFYHWDGRTRYPTGPIPGDNLPGPATASAGQRAGG